MITPNKNELILDLDADYLAVLPLKCGLNLAFVCENKENSNCLWMSSAKPLRHHEAMPAPSGPAIVQLCIKACLRRSPSAAGFPQCVQQCGPHQSLLPPHGHCQAPREREMQEQGKTERSLLPASCEMERTHQTSDKMAG